MKNYLLSLILLLYCTGNKIMAQSDSIFYHLNVKISSLIENEIIKNETFYQPSINIPFLIWENSSDTVTCFLSSLSLKVPNDDNAGAKQELVLVKSSNRYLFVGKYLLPIIFESDMEFTIGRNILSEGYRIRFTKDYGYIREYLQ